MIEKWFVVPVALRDSYVVLNILQGSHTPGGAVQTVGALVEVLQRDHLPLEVGDAIPLSEFK